MSLNYLKINLDIKIDQRMTADAYPGWSPNSYHPPGKDKPNTYWSDYHRYKYEYAHSAKGGNPFEEWFRRECGFDQDDPFVDELKPKVRYDCWDVLGIEQTDDESIIRKAYYKLARELHPDKGGDKADMVRLNNAYEYAMRFI